MVSLLVVALSLVTAICNSLSSVLVSMGMRDSDAETANLIMALVQTVILSVLLILDVPPLNLTALLYFAVSGLCASCIARLLMFRSFNYVNVGTSNALVGTSPLLATFLAIVFLGEPLLVIQLLGVLTVVAGIVMISRGRGGITLGGEGLYLPLLASLFYALSNIFRKLGMNTQPHSVLGAQFSTLAGVLGLALYLAVKGKMQKMRMSGPSFKYFAVSGVIGSLGWIAMMMALETGSVSVVTPIVFSYPLFSMLLSRVFMNDKITTYMVGGSVAIIIGVVLCSLT
ncbi:MAG: DMT family transporter [Candidatus Bathyarchaeota archaeon]|nr:DMT family transporter [Candidatus Bathyarchaeota archaeon]